MSVGTGAFSSMEADRGVEVNVVSDDEAFVGYRARDRIVPTDENGDGMIDLVTVENRFPENVNLKITDVDANVSPKNDGDSSPTVEIVEEKRDEFGTGDTDVILGEVDCAGGGGTSQVEITVTVEATGVVAKLFGDTREFDVSCIDSVSEVTFRGAGDADASAGGRTLEAEAWFVEPSDGEDKLDLDDATEEGPFDWDTSKKLRHSFDGDPSGKLVAVRFLGTNQTFVHPEYDVYDDDLPDNWGTGAGQEITDSETAEEDD
ncbi:hypothetical protein [Halorubrum aidingense]|nr:hypothetical protein [Halorubrum aidingense]